MTGRFNVKRDPIYQLEMARARLAEAIRNNSTIHTITALKNEVAHWEPLAIDAVTGAP